MPGRRRGREPRVRRPVALPIPGTPRGREDSGASLVRHSRRHRRWPRSPCRSRGRPVARPPPARSPSPSSPRTARSRSRSGRRRIVSLSPTATETLFAIGAASQVVAVDDQSDYPKSAPQTSLSGFTPERRGDRRLQARPRRHRVRPEGPVGRAPAARHHRPPPGRREELQGRVPADPPARDGHRPRRRRLRSSSRA